MKKTILTIATIFVLSVALGIPVFADEKVIMDQQDEKVILGSPQNVKNEKAGENEKRVKIDKTAQKLQRLNDSLKKIEEQKAEYIEKAKGKQERVTQKESKWQQELDRATSQDKAELESLNAEIQKWTQYQQKVKENRTAEIARIDEKLAKDLAAIDLKISEATDEATKQKLIDSKAKLQASADARKTAISTYITTLEGIFAERQKLWETRKALLIRRQTADSTFRNAIMEIRKTEILYGSQKTDEDIVNEANTKYQKRIDDVNAKIQKLQPVSQ